MFRRNKQQAQHGSVASAAKPKPPYVAAREEWDERYGDYIARARNWRAVAMVATLSSAILAGGVVYMGSQSRFVPYIVEVDRDGTAQRVEYAQKATEISPRLSKALLARFITDLRSVSPDTTVQKAAIFRVYKMLPRTSAALETVNAYFRSNSPFAAAQHSTVSVDLIGTPLLISEKSWQVEWWETRRALGGNVIDRVRYKAVLMAETHEAVEDEKQALDLDNPIGFFVTNLNWTQQQ